MRPVDKGQCPQTHYQRYGDALDDLAERLGLYCSYCEQPINHAPEIEHVQPKSLIPELETDWDNFLLGCKTCNSIKNNKRVDLSAMAFPDRDNTFRALTYYSDAQISVKQTMPPQAATLMSATVDLVKLDRHLANRLREDRPTKRDKRADFRRDVWDVANLLLGHYKQLQSVPELSDLIIKHAVARGFFSVWMTVFQNHPNMLNRFIAAFPGTDRASFDVDGRPVQRGRL